MSQLITRPIQLLFRQQQGGRSRQFQLQSVAMASSSNSNQQPLVMQLIVDREMVKQPEWTKGPLMAQASHAAIAAIQISSTSANTLEYVSSPNLTSMHKIVLQTPSDGGKTTLGLLSDKLKQARAEFEKRKSNGETQQGEDDFPLHYVWIEQPENVATCLAIAPNRKPAALKKILNKCSLLRD